MLEYEKEYICTKCRNIFTEKVNYHSGPKFSDRQVWANSVDPDQTAHDQVYTVCHYSMVWNHMHIVQFLG